MADLPQSILSYTQNDLEESMFRSLTIQRLHELDKSMALILQLMQTLSHILLIDGTPPPGYESLMTDIDEYLSKMPIHEQSPVPDFSETNMSVEKKSVAKRRGPNGRIWRS